MQTGTIARLLIDKGFGFIRDEGGTEHFFHRSAVRGAVFELLREGQRVEFTAEDSPRVRAPASSADRKLTVATRTRTCPPADGAAIPTARRPRHAAAELQPHLTEANGARWPSRSSKSVAPRSCGEAGFDSQALPPCPRSAAHRRIACTSVSRLRPPASPDEFDSQALHPAWPPGPRLRVRLPALHPASDLRPRLRVRLPRASPSVGLRPRLSSSTPTRFTRRRPPASPLEFDSHALHPASASGLASEFDSHALSATRGPGALAPGLANIVARSVSAARTEAGTDIDIRR